MSTDHDFYSLNLNITFNSNLCNTVTNCFRMCVLGLVISNKTRIKREVRVYQNDVRPRNYKQNFNSVKE